MHPMHTIEQSPAQRVNLTPMDSFAQQAWYFGQRILAAMLLLMMAPLFALLFLLVRGTSRGPFIYRQARPGKFGKMFTAYKIRSMRIGADRDARSP